MDFSKNKICQMFDLDFPLIQAGMVWVSGAKLAAASSNSGILGIIGAGSMTLDVLEQQIKKAKQLSHHPHRLAVNIPLFYPKAQEQIDIALNLGIKIFFTSAGPPKLFTDYLHQHQAKVVHVVSTPLQALKCQQAKVDAVVAEGFEAGGHNGKDEITSMALIPQVVDALSIPVIAAGGMACGKSMLAAMVLGAQGVQMGTRFVATIESSAHPHFKQAIVDANASSTFLRLKKITPVRLLDNPFAQKVKALEDQCASSEELLKLLGKGRARAGILEGDMQEGELEIGQIAGAIHDIPSVDQLVKEIKQQFYRASSLINI